MPDPIPSAAPKSLTLGYWALVAGLVAVLLLIGVYDIPLLNFFTDLWQRGLAALGLRQYAEHLQQGINGGITKRMLPAVATYAILYLSTCLLLLRVLLTPQQWLLVLKLYAGTLAVYVAIVVLGKVSGDAPWAYRLSRQILDFTISPLPVAGLYVLFRAGFGPQPARP